MGRVGPRPKGGPVWMRRKARYIKIRTTTHSKIDLVADCGAFAVAHAQPGAGRVNDIRNNRVQVTDLESKGDQRDTILKHT